MWKRILKVASRAEDQFDRLKGKLQDRLNRDKPIYILPYMGYGNTHQVVLRGRVLENHRVQPASDADSMWRNLLNIYRRLDTDEVPAAQVVARFMGQEKQFVADKEGYFLAEFTLDVPLVGGWYDMQLSFSDGERQADAIGQVIIPPASAQFGVISDLDDTVIRTDVTNLLKLARNTFLKNAHTRLPFHGVGQFYHALQYGAGEGVYNPIFYVSNSPYNLYDLLVDFFEIRGIPLGPVFLRDFGLAEQYLMASKGHKFTKIEKILQTYPKLPFILIGDSGERDPDIYLKAIKNYPGRIAAVYIRDVQPNKENTKRDKKVWARAEEAAQLGVDMLLIPDTLVAARHAVEKGFIAPNALPLVEKAVSQDEQTNEVERLLDEESEIISS